MNRNLNSDNSAPIQGKAKNASHLFVTFFKAKAATVFGSATLHQEKLPIIYANIRV